MDLELVTLVHFAAIDGGGIAAVVVYFAAIGWGCLGCGQQETFSQAVAS